MCGIFTMFYTDPARQVDAAMVKKATDLMSHRGPDDSGYFVSRNIGLGHRRLSIIDLSSGHQPMMNEDGRIYTVYNGEIYNFSEIRQDLILKGHTFVTNCDTEVIVHGYEEWGIECVQRFNGMFAFVIWDSREKRLWVVRDRLGVKPLYYYRDDDVFVCSSEIKPILDTGFIKPRMNENVLDAYLSVGYVPGPETMFKGIHKVLPGHYLSIEGQSLTDHEYWDFSLVPETDIGIKHAIEQVEELIIDSVQKRLMSDVPLGVFLSGGLDSSAVVGFMSKIMPNESISTFTIGYNEGYSEEHYAQTVAELFHTDHHVYHLEAENFFDSLKTLIRYAEEPIVEPAAIALYHISRLAREHAIVLLSGEGSDEVFAGYYLYRFMGIINVLQHILPNISHPLVRFLSSYLPKDKYLKYTDWVISPLRDRFQGTSSYLTPSLKRKYYSHDFFRERSTYLDEQFTGYFDRVKNYDPLSQMLYVDTKTWLVDDLLIKADKMTMATSVELRVPFLDYRLVEYLAGLPSRFKISNGEGKFILKKIVEQFLPNNIIHRKKMGFPVPTRDWFRGDLLEEVANILAGLKKTPWINPKILDELTSRHKNGIEDHSKIIMTLLVLAEWQKQYIV